MGDARGNYQELLPLKLITVKRNLLPGTGGDSFFAGGKGLARDRRGDGRGDREGYGGGWSVALLGNGSQGGAFFLRYCGVIGSESPRI